MSKPTAKELAPLRRAKHKNDCDAFHRSYDGVLDAKLRQLDPEYMEAMDAYLDSANMAFWYA